MYRTENIQHLVVCHIVPSRNNVVPIFVTRQLNSIERLGVENIVVTFDVSQFTLVYLFEFIFKVRKILKTKNINIIHAHWGSLLSFCSALASIFCAKLLITYRGSDLNPVPSENLFLSISRRFFSHMSSFFANHIICVSEQLSFRIKFMKKKITVIPDGSDFTLFFPIEKVAARQQLCFDTEQIKIFFYAGSQPEVKGYRLAQKVIFDIQKYSKYSVELEVVYSNKSPETLNLILNACDLLLFTSEYEGSPNIVREAIITGLPIISVDVGDVNLWISQFGSGCVVDRQSEQLAIQIINLLESGIDRKSDIDSKIDIDRMKTDFSLEATGEKLLNIYNNIC